MQKTNCVYVKCSQGNLNPGVQSVTKEMLLSSKWNPGKATKVHEDSILVKTRIKIFCHQNGL